MPKVLPFKLVNHKEDAIAKAKRQIKPLFRMTFTDENKNVVFTSYLIVDCVVFPNSINNSPHAMADFLPTSPYFPIIVDWAYDLINSMHDDDADRTLIPELRGIDPVSL